jgi:predicted DNA-binding antitoxin AbrB/MazE fold protein
MTTIDAIFAAGVFKPLDQVTIPENQRVRLTVEPVEAPASSNWLEAVRKFQQELVTRHGILPDSTPDIAADRRRHE